MRAGLGRCRSTGDATPHMGQVTLAALQSNRQVGHAVLFIVGLWMLGASRNLVARTAPQSAAKASVAIPTRDSDPAEPLPNARTLSPTQRVAIDMLRKTLVLLAVQPRSAATPQHRTAAPPPVAAAKMTSGSTNAVGITSTKTTAPATQRPRSSCRSLFARHREGASNIQILWNRTKVNRRLQIR